MSKRRDKKGRILRNGESQRSDGRYAYVYTDCRGKQKFIYSWKLEPTDPLPAGRRKCVSLREKERELLKELEDGIASCGGELTVLDLVQKYLLQKTGVRHSTKAGYKTVVNLLKKDDFGAKGMVDTASGEWEGIQFDSFHSGGIKTCFSNGG